MVKYKFRIAGMVSEGKPMIVEFEIGPEDTVADVKRKIRKELNIRDNLDIQLILPKNNEKSHS